MFNEKKTAFSYDALISKARRFILPPVTKGFLLRMLILALASILFFKYICIPMRINGHSMAPTYSNGQFIFCWTPSYWFSEPRRFDVVCVEMAGKEVALLKRVVGLAGETIAFNSGWLVIDGRVVFEPYVVNKGDWTLPPRLVRKGAVYIVGDNRSQPTASHTFGQTVIAKIMGKPISW